MPANSPLKRNAQIQLATNLDTVERSEDGIKILKGLTEENPKDIESIMALGNIERGKKKFAECGETYTLGIDALPVINEQSWVFYYFRGICFERSKQWPKSEADLKKALELKPEQPHVLNYLGYSWIDQGINLDEGMKMIRRAVEQRPDDGYIVDSLGWAYYRIGNFEEATKHLERAIDLQAGGSDHQRSPRRRLLEGRPQAGSEIPVGACARPEAGAGGTAEDRGQDQGRPAGRQGADRSRQRRQEGRQGRLNSRLPG